MWRCYALFAIFVLPNRLSTFDLTIQASVVLDSAVFDLVESNPVFKGLRTLSPALARIKNRKELRLYHLTNLVEF
jgi:hypothetical protein